MKRLTNKQLREEYLENMQEEKRDSIGILIAGIITMTIGLSIIHYSMINACFEIPFIAGWGITFIGIFGVFTGLNQYYKFKLLILINK